MNNQLILTNAFSKFIESFLLKIEEEHGVSRVTIAKLSGVSRQMMYRWMQKYVFPHPATLDTFFSNLKDNLDDKIQVEELMEEAYQALLLDYHERKEQAFC
jgi:transcriptional regulator with XRE-family HTH domain